MIVEFIGSSGAGKSTLARMLRADSAMAFPVLFATDLVVDRPGRRWITHPTAMNLLADVTVLPSFLGAYRKNRNFARYAADRLKRHAPSAFVRVNYMRNIVRRLGMHELAKRRGANASVLADEGTVLTAYYLFVYNDAPFGQADLEHFLSLVPLPDRIVYVKAPTEVLVDRSMLRPDRRRELAMDDRQQVERWIIRAQAVFEGLAKAPLIRDRILTVDNANGSIDGQRMVATKIAAFIKDRPPGGYSRVTRSINNKSSHRMLPSIEALIKTLNDEGIRYCHWKSNWALAETLMGKTDIDLLVHQRDARRFREILKRRGFVPARVSPFPSVEHHHALDSETGAIVHIHAYYQVITGESLVKNYRLPVEDMLLENIRHEGIINVPVMGAELIIFVLRMLVKHTMVIELMLLARQRDAVRKEAAWLMNDAAFEQARELLRSWLPQVEARLFQRGFEALRGPAPLWRRIVIGWQVRRQLRSFARRSELQARWVEAKQFAGLVRQRLAGSSKKLTPAGGGAVFAFVGSEATGKSTILSEIEHWLGHHYTVRRIHAGKPPGTWLTFIPHHSLPALRALFPSQRSTRVAARNAGSDEPTKQTFSLLFALRSVMLAYERRALLTRAAAWSENGTIVLSDRFPSAKSGAPDSPQLTHLASPSGRMSLRRWLARVEARLYLEIPAPDLVIYLTAPLEVTLARNEARDKTEAEDYVRFRHSLSSNPQFDGTVVHPINTDQALEASVREIKQTIWDEL